MPDIESISNCSARLISTTEGTVTCDYCGFISDNVPEMKLHKADAHDGLIIRGNQYEVTNIEKTTLLNHDDKGFPYILREHDTETRNFQKHVEIKHTDEPLDERKTIETLFKIKIETKGYVDPGDSSLPPVKGNESVPEGWKIRPDKNKTRTPY